MDARDITPEILNTIKSFSKKDERSNWVSLKQGKFGATLEVFYNGFVKILLNGNLWNSKKAICVAHLEIIHLEVMGFEMEYSNEYTQH